MCPITRHAWLSVSVETDWVQAKVSACRAEASRPRHLSRLDAALGEVLLHSTPVHQLQQIRVTQTREGAESMCRISGSAEARRGTELGLSTEYSSIRAASVITRGQGSLALLGRRHGPRGRGYGDG